MGAAALVKRPMAEILYDRETINGGNAYGRE